MCRPLCTHLTLGAQSPTLLGIFNSGRRKFADTFQPHAKARQWHDDVRNKDRPESQAAMRPVYFACQIISQCVGTVSGVFTHYQPQSHMRAAYDLI